MFARVTTGQVDFEKVNARQWPTNDPMTQLPGFRGNFVLHDRRTGKGMIVGLWATEADLQASMSMHQAAHQESTTLGLWVNPPTIEVFEVARKTDPPQ